MEALVLTTKRHTMNNKDKDNDKNHKGSSGSRGGGGFAITTPHVAQRLERHDSFATSDRDPEKYQQALSSDPAVKSFTSSTV
ncbi:hypothetical protein ACA910_015852 [Epithemia clementina (nom. ined.)]